MAVDNFERRYTESLYTTLGLTEMEPREMYGLKRNIDQMLSRLANPIFVDNIKCDLVFRVFPGISSRVEAYERFYSYYLDLTFKEKNGEQVINPLDS